MLPPWLLIMLLAANKISWDLFLLGLGVGVWGLGGGGWGGCCCGGLVKWDLKFKTLRLVLG